MKITTNTAFNFCFALLFGTAPLTAATVIYDFDALPASSSGTLFPGHTFAASGLTLTSGSIPDTVTVGTVFTLGSIDAQFRAVANTNSISAPNFAASSLGLSGNANDLLMAFSTPVTSVALTTDDASPDAAGADVVRLLALEATGNPMEFRVLALVSGLDDATTAPANLLSVNLGGTPFSYAVFQHTTEAEGIDNLTVEVVPEPSSLLILASALGLLAIRRERP